MDGASSSASSSGYRPRKGVRLRPLRRRRGPASSLASRGGDGDGGENGGGGAQDDLALPLGMSFAAVLARVVNSSNGPGERLHPVILSKICTSAVKESLANTYGARFDSFMRNFENSFSSTLRTLHRINEIPDYETSPAPECSFKHGGSAAVGNNLSTVDSQNQTHEVIVSSVESQLVLYARDSQQLAQSARSRSSHEADRSILNAFERSVKEQARSNELKEFEIGLNMRKLQLKQSQLALSSYTHMHYDNFEADDEDQVARLVVYVLDDYENQQWRLKHMAEASYVLLGQPCHNLARTFEWVAIHPDCNMIFYTVGWDKTLVSYDMDRCQVQVICTLGEDTREKYFPYVPLFSELQTLHR